MKWNKTKKKIEQGTFALVFPIYVYNTGAKKKYG